MKHTLVLPLLTASLLFLSGCGTPAQSSAPPNTSLPARTEVPDGDRRSMPTTEAERQVAAFAADAGSWQFPDAYGWRGYAITDLDQDGNWELIAALDEGTGHFTTTLIFESDPIHPPFLQVGRGTSLVTEETLEALSRGGPVAAGPLLLPHWELDEAPQHYTVYHDTDSGAYHCVYEDTISYAPDGFGTFHTKVSFSLGDNGTEGILLGCEQVTYGEVVTRDRWDLHGNYIDKETYDGLAKAYFEGLKEMDAGILWVSPPGGEALDEEAWYQLLKTSMEAFSLTEA